MEFCYVFSMLSVYIHNLFHFYKRISNPVVQRLKDRCKQWLTECGRADWWLRLKSGADWLRECGIGLDYRSARLSQKPPVLQNTKLKKLKSEKQELFIEERKPGMRNGMSFVSDFVVSLERHIAQMVESKCAAKVQHLQRPEQTNKLSTFTSTFSNANAGFKAIFVKTFCATANR